MKLTSYLISLEGDRLETLYTDTDSFSEYVSFPVKGVHAYCFCGGKLVVVYSEGKGYWTPPGGGVETGETVEEAAIREIGEETNMRVLAQETIGLLAVQEKDGTTTYQARTACIVEPVGPFIADPDEDVTEIRLIEPANVTDYFDWGEVGAHQLARAQELYREMKKR